MTNENFYDFHVFVCMNKRPSGHPRGCCANHDAEKLRNYMKVRAKELGLKKTRVNQAGCLDRCELGPVLVIYPEGIWYRPLNTDDIDEILAEHIQKGQVVERLMIANDAV